MLHVPAFQTPHKRKERGQATWNEAVNLVGCWEQRRKRWNIISCAFWPPPAQEVNQCHWIILPVGVSRSENTHRASESFPHSFHTPCSDQHLSTSTLLACWITDKHWKPVSRHSWATSGLSGYRYRSSSGFLVGENSPPNLSASQESQAPWEKNSIPTPGLQHKCN